MVAHSSLARGASIGPASAARPPVSRRSLGPRGRVQAPLPSPRPSPSHSLSHAAACVDVGVSRRGATCHAAAVEAAVAPVRLTAEDVAGLQDELQGASPLEIMDKALSIFGPDAAIAFSGAEDVALIELASLTGRPFRVFCLDTGRLNAETYQFLDKVREHYGVAVEVMFPEAEAVQALVQSKGLFSFYQDGHQECCSIRKVQPLRRALRGLRAWITGQRRDQSADTRGSLQVVELDGAFAGVDGAGSLVKFNPLAAMSGATVWSLLDAQGAPVNELHSRGYVSIGCEPCTRPVLPHQHEREGRWWWETAASKECGLHKTGGAPAAASAPGALAPAAPGAAPLKAEAVASSAASPVPEGAAAGTASLSREDQEWPDLYESPDITTLSRDTLVPLLEGQAVPGANGSVAREAESWLVVVYAPWCPHCQALEPALGEVAEALAKSAQPGTRVAKFRGDRQERAFVAEKLGVRSFPSIFMLRPSSSQESVGMDTSARLVKRVSERRDVGSLLRWVEALQ